MKASSSLSSSFLSSLSSGDFFSCRKKYFPHNFLTLLSSKISRRHQLMTMDGNCFLLVPTFGFFSSFFFYFLSFFHLLSFFYLTSVKYFLFKKTKKKKSFVFFTDSGQRMKGFKSFLLSSFYFLFLLLPSYFFPVEAEEGELREWVDFVSSITHSLIRFNFNFLDPFSCLFFLNFFLSSFFLFCFFCEKILSFFFDFFLSFFYFCLFCEKILSSNSQKIQVRFN